MTEAITSNNTHLSEPISDRPAGEVVSNPHSVQGCTDPKILAFIAAATSSNTRRAYQSDLAHFIATGGCIPATAQQVARYLAYYAGLLAISTLARRLEPISKLLAAVDPI